MPCMSPHTRTHWNDALMVHIGISWRLPPDKKASATTEKTKANMYKHGNWMMKGGGPKLDNEVFYKHIACVSFIFFFLDIVVNMGLPSPILVSNRCRLTARHTFEREKNSCHIRMPTTHCYYQINRLYFIVHYIYICIYAPRHGFVFRYISLTSHFMALQLKMNPVCMLQIQSEVGGKYLLIQFSNLLTQRAIKAGKKIEPKKEQRTADLWCYTTERTFEKKKILTPPIFFMDICYIWDIHSFQIWFKCIDRR